MPRILWDRQVDNHPLGQSLKLPPHGLLPWELSVGIRSAPYVDQVLLIDLF
jgi:hypothetical protein